jgi:hypothetical protein
MRRLPICFWLSLSSRLALTLAALILIAGMGLACQKPMTKPAQPLTLILSSGGGFSGLVEGFTMNSLGEVSAWSKQPGQPETPQWTIKGRPDSTLSLVESLKPFLSVNMQETGNMTTRIRLVLPDSTWQWSKSGNGASEDAAEPFRTWYARAEAYCRSLKPKSEP